MRTAPVVTGIAAAALPPLLLAALGVSHPTVLTPESAPWWRDLHVIGLVAFPLLALGPLVAVRGRSRALRAAVWVLGLVYAAFYTALDSIAGIGGGHATMALGPGPWVAALFGIADAVVLPGVYAYLALAVLVPVVLLLTVTSTRDRVLAVVGGALVVPAAAVFLTSHIYYPVGVAVMVALAVGWSLLAVPGPPARPHRPAPSGAVRSSVLDGRLAG